MSGAATAIAIGAGVAGIGSIAGGAISANGAQNAASTQANAADQAAQLQYKASQQALGFQQQQYADTQKEEAPWLQSGDQGLSNLDYLLGVQQPSSLSGASNGTASPGASGTTGTATASPNTSLGSYGSLLQSYPGGQFSAPTGAQMEANDPGYQARLNLGTQSLQQSAAARGNVLTGGTAEALNKYAQDYASNEYGNYYNQAYNTYASNYNQYENQQTNTYNRLAALSGTGQTTANNLATIGANTANSEANTVQSGANAQAQGLNNAAAANASGIVGSANAWSGAVQNGSSSLSNMLLLKQLTGGSGSGGEMPSLYGGYDYAGG